MRQPAVAFSVRQLPVAVQGAGFKAVLAYSKWVPSCRAVSYGAHEYV